MNHVTEANPPAWKIHMGMLPNDIGMLGAMPVFSAAHSAWYARPPGYVRALRLPAALAAPVRSQGLGDAAAFNQASIDLHNQIELPIQAGDTFLNAGDTVGALSAYKAAGQTAATTNGPQIDAAGAVTATQPLTQFAWGLNGQLQAEGNATAAQGLAHQMLVTYQDAIVQGLLALQNPPSAGHPNPALVAAAQALSAYLQNHGVPSVHSSLPIVSDFQRAWDADGSMGAALVIDGKYGPRTASALAAVLGSPAPGPNQGGGPTPAPVPVPSGGSTQSVTVAPGGSNTAAAWILGAALVGAAGIAGYAWYNKGGGKAMLTRRRARKALPRARARRRR